MKRSWEKTVEKAVESLKTTIEDASVKKDLDNFAWYLENMGGYQKLLHSVNAKLTIMERRMETFELTGAAAGRHIHSLLSEYDGPGSEWSPMYMQRMLLDILEIIFLSELLRSLVPTGPLVTLSNIFSWILGILPSLSSLCYPVSTLFIFLELGCAWLFPL